MDNNPENKEDNIIFMINQNAVPGQDSVIVFPENKIIK